MNKLKLFFIGELLENSVSPYEKARIDVNFIFSIFSFVAFTFVFIIALTICALPVTIPAGFSALFCLIHLFILKYTRNVRVASIIFSILIFSILFGNMFFNTHTLHFGGFLWVIVLVLFVTFNIGRTAGIIASFTSLVFTTLFSITKLPENIENAVNFKPIIFYMLGFEFLIGLSIIFYLINVFIVTNKKVTNELKKSNENLENQNRIVIKQYDEKIIMLKEIHHRVKNNLQVINSMLRLQSDKIDDVNSKIVFSDAQNRILAMSFVHQRMYQSGNFLDVQFDKYIKELSEDIIKQHSVKHQIESVITSSINNIDVQKMVPIGLILNELISNSLKHGISSVGKITIDLAEENEKLIFTYSDNGIGIKEPLKEGFGMELIKLLTEQLDGKLKISNQPDGGVLFQFVFMMN
ncbi:MAG: sensor histidine kinase [Vicingaceae bacterium]|nr:sensor histidine kinase [Vicingaceae bacterium]